MSESIPAIEPESHETDAAESGTKGRKHVAGATVANVLREVAGAPETVEPVIAGTEQGAASRETGGPEGPEPTRFGDWERKGRCIDF